MVTEQHQAIAAEVLTALESDRLDLPTLPDMANKVRELIDDPNVSAEKLIHLLSTDPAISAHIVKAANSAAFSGGKSVDTLRAAVSRLGYRMLRNLVMTITMSKLFRAESPVINQQLKKLWERSREVAANSYVLALHQKHLKPEQAMLAGLVCGIGALPLCIYADRHHPRLDRESLESLIRRFSATVGTRLLKKWHFPDELVETVSGHQDIRRSPRDGQSDYVDVVTVANLQIPSTVKFVAWENVAAVSRLGYSPAECQNFLESHREELDAVREMMGISTSPKPQQAQPSAPAPEADRSSVQSGLMSSLRKLFK